MDKFKNRILYRIKMTGRKTILYAEDYERLRKKFEELLRRNFPEDQYSLEVFEDGNSLRARLDTDSKNVDLVITDEAMPGFTGLEIIGNYTKREEFKHIPFILLTGESGLIGKIAREKGAFAYVDKLDPLEYIIRLTDYTLNHSNS